MRKNIVIYKSEFVNTNSIEKVFEKVNDGFYVTYGDVFKKLLKNSEKT